MAQSWSQRPQLAVLEELGLNQLGDFLQHLLHAHVWAGAPW